MGIITFWRVVILLGREGELDSGRIYTFHCISSFISSKRGQDLKQSDKTLSIVKQHNGIQILLHSSTYFSASLKVYHITSISD